jgi:hypothetical protein
MGTAFYGRRFSFAGADLWRPCPATASAAQRTCGQEGVVEYVAYARLLNMLEQHRDVWSERFDAQAQAS